MKITNVSPQFSVLADSFSCQPLCVLCKPAVLVLPQSSSSLNTLLAQDESSFLSLLTDRKVCTGCYLVVLSGGKEISVKDKRAQPLLVHCLYHLFSQIQCSSWAKSFPWEIFPARGAYSVLSYPYAYCTCFPCKYSLQFGDQFSLYAWTEPNQWAVGGGRSTDGSNSLEWEAPTLQIIGTVSPLLHLGPKQGITRVPSHKRSVAFFFPLFQ